MNGKRKLIQVIINISSFKGSRVYITVHRPNLMYLNHVAEPPITGSNFALAQISKHGLNSLNSASLNITIIAFKYCFMDFLSDSGWNTKG